MTTVERDTGPAGLVPATEPGRAPSTPVPGEASREWLLDRYREYRRRQGAALLSLVPREGIRPLYRAALERAGDRGEPPDDVMAFVAEFAGELLPLPPFEVWCRDFREHRAAHLEEADLVSPPPAVDVPVTVELRSFRAPDGEPWYASLDVRRGDGGWSGSIAFHPESGGRPTRTADIFREADPGAIRARFSEFGDTTLQAFLRSVLP